VTTPQAVQQTQTEEKPAPGSLLEQIQREVDDVKVVPVPTPEPLDSTPQ
jgi:outer membrane protein assembly factor BamE